VMAIGRHLLGSWNMGWSVVLTRFRPAVLVAQEVTKAVRHGPSTLIGSPEARNHPATRASGGRFRVVGWARIALAARIGSLPLERMEMTGVARWK
jgi:hypothetical protein